MELQPQFSEAEIRDTVRRLAGEISAAYRRDGPVLVGVLKGSFVFLADLIRELTVPFEIDFVREPAERLTRSNGLAFSRAAE